MKTIFKTIIAASSIVIFSTAISYASNPLPKSTDKLVKYGEVEGWTVYDNETRGHCLIVSSDDNGAVQMGVTANHEEIGYLGIFTKHDLGLKPHKKSKIFVSLGGRLYEGVSTHVSEHLKGGYTGGYILTNNPQFKKDIAKKYEMIVFPKTVGAFVVDLTGTYKAMKMARECFKK